MSALGWGFVGASTWAGTRLIPAVQATDGHRAVAVSSGSAQRARSLATTAGIPRAYDSTAALLADPDVDAVYISSVNELHARQALDAAAAGKHVLLEKPFALTLEEAEGVLDACASAGVVLATNHHLRGAPAISAMRRLIADGEIGAVNSAQISFLTSLPPEIRTWRLQGDGGGAAMDLTVHSADTMAFLLDDEIVDVSATSTSGSLGQGRVEDSIAGVMRTADGTMFGFHDSFVVPHAGNTVEVHGTNGSLIARQALGPDPVGQLWIRRDGAQEAVELSDRRPLCERVIDRFGAAVRGEAEPLCSGVDGVASLAVALAALDSARQGRTITVAGRSARPR